MPKSPPPEMQRLKPAQPPMQVIRGGLIYDPRNPPVGKLFMQTLAEAVVWGSIFGAFGLAAVLLLIGLTLRS